MPSKALDARGVRRGGREAVERAGGTLLRERPQPAAVCALSARQALSDIVLGVGENAVRAGQAVLRGDLQRPAATMRGCRSHEGEEQRAHLSHHLPTRLNQSYTAVGTVPVR